MLRASCHIGAVFVGVVGALICRALKEFRNGRDGGISFDFA